MRGRSTLTPTLTLTLQACVDNDADILGCSGLITPSLDEMVTLALTLTLTLTLPLTSP